MGIKTLLNIAFIALQDKRESICYSTGKPAVIVDVMVDVELI